MPPELASEVEADPDTFYAIGYFDLADDELLEIRITPPACDYWGLQVTNHWLEPLEHEHLVTHLNHATAEGDADGAVVACIAPAGAPGENVIHSLGHPNGAIFFRVVDAQSDAIPLPTCRVRKLRTPAGEARSRRYPP